jgi:single-stranded DNA-binding protein
MIDARNFGSITGGLVADPELLGADNNVVRLRIAADYAGKDREDSNNRTGYFNVTMFLNDDNSNTKFIKGQIDNGNLKKGSQIQVLYRLQQDRWEADGKRQQSVGLIAESISYAGSGSRESNTNTATATTQQGTQADIPEAF